MAKVLLINSNRLKQPWPVIPFGLCYVAAAIEEAGHELHFLDLCFSSDCQNDIAKAVGGFRPDVIGISVRNIDNGTAYNTHFMLDKVKKRVIQPCKAVFAGPIVIGGPAVGISGAEMLRFFDLEYAVRGDGEAVIVAFVKRLQEKRPLDGLPGLVIRRGGRIVQDPLPHYIEDLNTLPSPKPHKYIDLRPYRQFDSPLQVQTKRGCALKCSYCTYNRIEGPRYRLRDPERVADEIEQLVRETDINHIEFIDSTFNIPSDHAKGVLRAIAAKKLKLRLHTMGLNPKGVDETLVDLMKEVGFTEVALGAEAGCDIILKSLAKNYTADEVVKAGEILHNKGIPINWFLVFGSREETRATLDETLSLITRTASPWDLINIGIGIRVYKGSPIAERMMSEQPDCTDDAFLHPVEERPDKIDLNTLKSLVKHAAHRHTNIFMYDENEVFSKTIMKIGVFLQRLFAPRQPVWRWYILLRRIEKASGIGWIKRAVFERRHRAILQVESKDNEP